MHGLTITGGVLIVPMGLAVAAAAAVSLGCGLAVLLARRRAVWQTTLAAAWWWTLAALAAWSVVELLAAFCSPVAAPPWLAACRLAAVALSFCPVVALMGAKRPQHTAWQFVVVSLWIILALPAAEALWLYGGQRVVVSGVRAVLLGLLVLLAPVNFVPTRFWLASLLAAAGQIVAVAPYLDLHKLALPHAGLIGLMLSVLALVAAYLAGHRARPAASPCDRLWLDFRDTFGLFWSLRVQERFHAEARRGGFDLELSWSGLRQGGQGGATIDPATEEAAYATIQGLLRRFVSREWIAQRL